MAAVEKEKGVERNGKRGRGPQEADWDFPAWGRLLELLQARNIEEEGEDENRAEKKEKSLKWRGERNERIELADDEQMN